MPPGTAGADLAAGFNRAARRAVEPPGPAIPDIRSVAKGLGVSDEEFDQIAVRLDASGSPFEIGTDQPDASTQPNMVTVPWTNMADVQLSVAGALDTPPSGPLQPFDLFSGDCFPTVFDQLGTSNGQIAIQQTLPIPINVLATICNVRIQDDASP